MGVAPAATPPLAGFRPETREFMAQIVSRYPTRRAGLLPLLSLAQEEHGYLTVEAMEQIAAFLGLSPTEVYETASFYTLLHFRPIGEHLVQVCTNISCALLGARPVVEQFKQRLGIREGETTADGLFTLETVECIAACGGAPALQVNGRYYERMTPAAADALLDRLAGER